MVDTLGEWETDLAVVELFDVWTSGLGGDDWFHFDDLDRVGTSTMTGTHITVASGDSSTDAQVTVFAVHVVGS